MLSLFSFLHCYDTILKYHVSLGVCRMYLKDVLRYRKVWIGVALIWIILCHLPFDFGPVIHLTSLGYGGVDICLFASGIGCFYSLSSDPCILNFMKRRLKRLVPTYLIFISVWLFYRFLRGTFTIQMCIGNLLAIQHLTGHQNDFNWYISAIFLLYLLAPYFMMIAKRETPLRKVLFLIFLLVCTIPFWHANTYIITITRLPIFYLGMVFAQMCKQNKKITPNNVIGLIIAFLIGIISILAFKKFAASYLWSYGLFWYPFILITPPFCMAVSSISMRLEKTKWTKPIVSFLSLCGDYSFELYLVHVLLIDCIRFLISTFEITQLSPLIWIIGGILLFAGCVMLRHFSAFLSRLLAKYCSKNN